MGSLSVNIKIIVKFNIYIYIYIYIIQVDYDIDMQTYRHNLLQYNSQQQLVGCMLKHILILSIIIGLTDLRYNKLSATTDIIIGLADFIMLINARFRLQLCLNLISKKNQLICRSR